MKPIDFTKYPKILPYVKDIMDNSYFRPFAYSVLTEEVYIDIVSKWVEHYEKHIDTAVKNTMSLYNLTSEETGYSALGSDWENRSKFNLPKRFDEKLVRQWWREKFIACISHLYQSIISDYKNEIKGGATGCLITCSFNVRFVDSDYKRVEKIAVSNLNMQLNICIGSHDEIDIFEK